MKPFQFKQFSVYQDKTAMKISTDAVLLGSWAEVSSSISILDIGTGTGIISLMLAQRTDKALITAIEIEENAFQQAKSNFKNSKWASRIHINHISLQNFNTSKKFDTIISNPPFFDNNHFSTDHKRTIARHTSSLSYLDLIKKTIKLLTITGYFHIIIPYNVEQEFKLIALNHNLYPTSILRIRGNKISPIKRSLITFSFLQNKCSVKELIIEKERHNYTEEYINLTKDFYLKM